MKKLQESVIMSNYIIIILVKKNSPNLSECRTSKALSTIITTLKWRTLTTNSNKVSKPLKFGIRSATGTSLQARS